jgi:serine/threonine-protein phosphatase Stp1
MIPARDEGDDADMVRWLNRFRQSPEPPPAASGAAAADPAPMDAAPVRIESRALTHEGRVRALNEDSHVACDGGGLWAVADGMGGHEGGGWASGRIVDALAAAATAGAQGGLEPLRDAAADAIRAANGAILAEARARGKQMGSTVVALIVAGNRYFVLWVGDSRAYRLRGGVLTQLSRDHSQVQEMVARGLLTPEQAIGHPMGHILSRAVGVQAEIEVDTVSGEVQPGDIFLLTSDGLHNVVGDGEIARQLSREAPGRALEKLVELTLAGGAPDNVTGIAVWAGEPTLLSFADPIG